MQGWISGGVRYLSAMQPGRKGKARKPELPDLTHSIKLFAVFLSVSYLESIQITNKAKIIVFIFDL